MKKRILIVEDDLATRMLLDHVLGQQFELTLLANGKEALDWLNQGNIADLILTDLDMPHMSGMDLIYKMESYPLYMQIPLIVLSAQEQRELDEIMQSGTVHSVVSKPFHYKTLLWNVEDALAKVAFA